MPISFGHATCNIQNAVFMMSDDNLMLYSLASYILSLHAHAL